MSLSTESREDPQGYILLDTCIIEYFADEDKSSAVVDEVARSTFGSNFVFGISEFTIFECLHTAPVEIERRRLEQLDQFLSFPVTSDVLVVAARVGSLYRQDRLGKERPDYGDLIIAATALTNGAFICTANPKDFPYPFFKSEVVNEVGYVKGGKDECVLIHYLRPQLEKIEASFNKRNSNPPKG